MALITLSGLACTESCCVIQCILASCRLCLYLVYKGAGAPHWGHAACSCMDHPPVNKGMPSIPTASQLFFCLPESQVNLPGLDRLQDSTSTSTCPKWNSHPHLFFLIQMSWGTPAPPTQTPFLLRVCNLSLLLYLYCLFHRSPPHCSFPADFPAFRITIVHSHSPVSACSCFHSINLSS